MPAAERSRYTVDPRNYHRHPRPPKKRNPTRWTDWARVTSFSSQTLLADRLLAAGLPSGPDARLYAGLRAHTLLRLSRVFGRSDFDDSLAAAAATSELLDDRGCLAQRVGVVHQRRDAPGLEQVAQRLQISQVWL